MLEQSDFSAVVCRELGLNTPEPDLTEWVHMVKQSKAKRSTVHIGLVGKYVGLHDAYLSVAEALRHAGFYHQTHVEIHWLDSEEITAESCENMLSGLDGILVPGGFGSRGIEGMILAAQYARENRLPYFGICLGMQVAVIEYAAETLSGIPSIIYGLVGMLCFCQFFGLQTSLLAGSLTLVIVNLPTIMRTVQESLKTVPQSYREGAFGLGAGNGLAKHIFAADSDIVFCTVCEEWGLIIGVCCVLFVVCIALFAVRSASLCRSSFYAIAACSAMSILLFQMILNVFGTVDYLPFTGVTFPFLSNGGSSMMSAWGMLAFVKAADTRQNASFATSLPSNAKRRAKA